MPSDKLLLIQDKSSSEELEVPLKKLGYLVVGTISDGEQAIKKIAELQPDLVLISIHLNGEMGGIPIGKQIYDHYDIPVIYISDQSGQTTIQRSGGTAPFGYLFGKEDEKQILATIEVALTRHKMEKRVRDNEQLLRKIAENYPNSYVSVIEEDYTIGFTSGQEFRNQNINPEQFIGLSLEQIWAENIDIVREYYEKTFMGEEQSFQLSTNNQYLDFKTTPLKSKDGSIHQILAFVENITKRKLVEQKLKESESWLNAILQSIGEGVIAVDDKHCVRFMNPVAEKLTGRKTSVVLGEPLEEVFPIFYSNSEERVTFSHALSYLNNQNLRTGFEATLDSNEGNPTPLEVFISPISEKNKSIGIVLSFRDISERKHAMREIQRHAMRSEAMLRAAEQLNARMDVKAVLNQVSGICNETLDLSVTSAFLFDSIENTFVSTTITANKIISDYAIDPQTFEKRYKVSSELITSFLSPSEPVVEIIDIQNFDMPGIPYLDIIKDLDVRSLVISGMYQSNSLIGILVAQMNGEIRKFTQEELDLLRGLADQAAIAVGNAILFEQVVASRERQQILTRRLVDLQEDERRNLAQELHDQIGQMMTGLQFSLSALLTEATDKQKGKISDAQEQVRKLIALTREISMNLRPSMLDDTGLILTLMWHLKRFESQTDIEINLKHYNLLEKRFSSSIETAVFRIIQEALTNIARHAKTDSVNIELHLEEQVIKLEISDQGQGFNLDEVDVTAHMGLTSMRERAYAVGGLLEIDTAPGEGTRIQVAIPLEGKVERRHYERQSPSG